MRQCESCVVRSCHGPGRHQVSDRESSHVWVDLYVVVASSRIHETGLPVAFTRSHENSRLRFQGVSPWTQHETGSRFRSMREGFSLANGQTILEFHRIKVKLRRLSRKEGRSLSHDDLAFWGWRRFSPPLSLTPRGIASAALWVALFPGLRPRGRSGSRCETSRALLGMRACLASRHRVDPHHWSASFALIVLPPPTLIVRLSLACGRSDVRLRWKEFRLVQRGIYAPTRVDLVLAPPSPVTLAGDGE